MAERRIWNVGQVATFPFKVQTSSGTAVALLPDYPKYEIISPSGLPVQEGVATAVGLGSYEVQWTVPLQSEVSTGDQCWRVNVYIVTARRAQQELHFDFDVVNKSLSTSQKKRDIIETHLEGRPYRAIWRGDVEPAELSLECYYTRVPTETSSAPLPTTITKSAMTKIYDNGDTVFYYDIPAANFVPGTQGMFDNQFTLLWTSRDTAVAEEMTEYQQLRIMRRSGFELITGLRFIVDRFQHRFGSKYYMSDGDLCEAMQRGLGMLNQWHPVTLVFSDSNVPTTLHTFWIMLGAWWMLRSQHMVAGMQAFNFSGQSISLDQDLTGALDSAIQGLMDWLNTHLTPAKTTLYRQGASVGSVAVRPARIANPNNRVYKIDSSGPGGGTAPPSLMGVAQMIGLFA